MSRDLSIIKLIKSLHEPMVTHNWSEALRVLQYSGNSKEVMDVVWKVGYELICKEPDKLTRCSLMRDFFSKMKKAKKYLTNTELVIDYISFWLSNGDLDAAKSVCQEASLEKLSTTEDEELMLQDHLQAYHGLVFYLTWKECLKNETTLNQSTVSDGSFNFLSQEHTNRMQAMEYASKTIRLWAGLEGLEGTWDSFIEKYIEVLLFCEKPEIAVSVLQRYSQNRSTNIYAQKRLYQVYIDHPKHVQNQGNEIIKQLKRIAELNPADPLVLEYCKYELDESKIHCLFTLLDYPRWQHELKPWKMIAKFLQNCFIHKDKGTENIAQVMKEEWTHRQTWWPSFHFTKYVFQQDSNDLKLLLQKYITASILCRKETEYTHLATKKLTEAGYIMKVQKITQFMLPQS